MISYRLIDISKYTFLLFLELFSVQNTFGQNDDSTAKVINFRGTSSVTNNGFSFIPAFSLGKPAAIFNFNINGGKRFSFEPEFRFALKDGRPWSFIFIWRYKLINQKRFQTTLGSHFPTNFTFSSSKTPFFLGSSFNKPLKSDIPEKSLNWNVSLGYTLDRKLIVKK